MGWAGNHVSPTGNDAYNARSRRCLIAKREIMIKKINIEEIKKREEFLSGKLLTRKEVECALENKKQVRKKKYGKRSAQPKISCL